MGIEGWGGGVVGCSGNRGVGSGSGLCMREKASSDSGFLLEKEHSLPRQHRHTLDLTVVFFLSWCTHPRIRELVDGHPPALLLPRQLIELPQDYTVLVKQLSTYRWGRDRRSIVVSSGVVFILVGVMHVSQIMHI